MLLPFSEKEILTKQHALRLLGTPGENKCSEPANEWVSNSRPNAGRKTAKPFYRVYLNLLCY